MRYAGGIQFRCERPGTWISLCYRYRIIHMMKGTVHSQWEVYDDKEDDLVGRGLTFKEALRDAFPKK